MLISTIHPFKGMMVGIGCERPMEQISSKMYLQYKVNYRSTIPLSTSAQSSVYGKQGKEEKDKNVTMCSSNTAKDQVFKVN